MTDRDKVVEIDHVREKLIELLDETTEKLKELCGGLNDHNGNGVRADHLIANGVVLDKGESKLSSKWIPVAERLPEKEGRYLCVKQIGKSGAVYVQLMNGDSYGFSLEHIYHDDVTHWMPLPQPPKGE